MGEGASSVRDVGLVLRLCGEAVVNPEWQPRDGVTHCNSAADYVAKGFGCDEMHDKDGNPLTADEMFALFCSGENWRPVTVGGTWMLANQGSLIFAAMNSKSLNESHGHVCTIIPGDPVYSGHWEGLAPLCMNVGKENFIGRPCSFAFRQVPYFFGWKPTIEDQSNA